VKIEAGAFAMCEEAGGAIPSDNIAPTGIAAREAEPDRLDPRGPGTPQ